MNKIFATAFAAVIAVTGTAATTTMSSAAPVVPLIQSGDNANNVVNVNHRRWHRRHDRGDFRRGGFHRRGDSGWYNGHRGYRHYRPGYRRHNDFWFPAGAFIAGAIIGGALSDPGPTYYVQPRRVYRGGGSSAHVQWCYNRYRSYDAYSNTFQPYNGPRQQCWSPYS